MKRVKIKFSEALLPLLKRSALGANRQAGQVKLSVAIQLFREVVISIGKAAEIAGEALGLSWLEVREMGALADEIAACLSPQGRCRIEKGRRNL